MFGKLMRNRNEKKEAMARECKERAYASIFSGEEFEEYVDLNTCVKKANDAVSKCRADNAEIKRKFIEDKKRRAAAVKAESSAKIEKDIKVEEVKNDDNKNVVVVNKIVVVEQPKECRQDEVNDNNVIFTNNGDVSISEIDILNDSKPDNNIIDKSNAVDVDYTEVVKTDVEEVNQTVEEIEVEEVNQTENKEDEIDDIEKIVRLAYKYDYCDAYDVDEEQY